jgi:hypothetical protein
VGDLNPTSPIFQDEQILSVERIVTTPLQSGRFWSTPNGAPLAAGHSEAHSLIGSRSRTTVLPRSRFSRWPRCRRGHPVLCLTPSLGSPYCEDQFGRLVDGENVPLIPLRSNRPDRRGGGSRRTGAGGMRPIVRRVGRLEDPYQTQLSGKPKSSLRIIVMRAGSGAAK